MQQRQVWLECSTPEVEVLVKFSKIIRILQFFRMLLLGIVLEKAVVVRTKDEWTMRE